MFKKFLVILLGITSSAFATNKENYVVCIHGFLGSSWNLYPLKKNLEKDGWDVVNWGYPSRDHLIAEHGEQLVQNLIELAATKPEQPIHFVTHSMGALVLLSALNHPECPLEAKLGKVVLITPPLNGAKFARWLDQFSMIKTITKKHSGQELMTKSSFEELGIFPDSLENILVIAGTLGFNPLLKTENDGTLALEETYLKSPHKRMEIKRGHKTIIFSKKVHHAIRDFLLK